MPKRFKSFVQVATVGIAILLLDCTALDAQQLGVEPELEADVFKSIGYRWAENLRPYDAEEPQRFVRYYTSMANASTVVLGRSSATVE